VCRSDDPLADRARLAVEDLADQVMLRFPPGWGVRDTVDRVLGRAPEVTEIADYALMTKLVLGGFGTTLMPESAVRPGEGLRAVPVDDPRLRWRLSAVISTSRRPAAATTALLRALIDSSCSPGTGQAMSRTRA
jgi:DNA-binding transcriptional LysR family regulator